MSKQFTVEIPFIGPSTNVIYAGVHWTVRKKHADDAHLAVRVAFNNSFKINSRVDLTFTPYVAGRGYDTSNYSYTAKLIEDGLVKCGVLINDNTKYVRKIIYHPPIKIKKKNDSYMLVSIEEVKNG